MAGITAAASSSASSPALLAHAIDSINSRDAAVTGASKPKGAIVPLPHRAEEHSAPATPWSRPSAPTRTDRALAFCERNHIYLSVVIGLIALPLIGGGVVLKYTVSKLLGRALIALGVAAALAQLVMSVTQYIRLRRALTVENGFHPRSAETVEQRLAVGQPHWLKCVLHDTTAAAPLQDQLAAPLMARANNLKCDKSKELVFAYAPNAVYNVRGDADLAKAKLKKPDSAEGEPLVEYKSRA